jgi:hypothetical protein
MPDHVEMSTAPPAPTRPDTVPDPAAHRVADWSEIVGLAPNALRRTPTLYELLMSGLTQQQADGYGPDDGLHLEFGAGSLHISAAALALSAAMLEDDEATPADPADPVLGDDEDVELDETAPDFPPSDANGHPDLGERVL